MAIRGILYDFDGTLANTTPLILATFQKTLEHFLDQPVEQQAIINTFGLPLRQGLSVVTVITDPDRIEEMVQYYRHYNIKWHDQMIEPFPGVAEGCQKLQEKGIAQAIVTSKFKATCQRGLDCLGLSSYIDGGIIGAQECQAHKPDPEPMASGAALLGLAPEECLCVGDSPYDLLSGRAAGCRATVKVGWSSFKQDFFDGKIHPDYVIGQVSDLLSIIDELNQKR